jgi:hypothetical protein
MDSLNPQESSSAWIQRLESGQGHVSKGPVKSIPFPHNGLLDVIKRCMVRLIWCILPVNAFKLIRTTSDDGIEIPQAIS